MLRSHRIIICGQSIFLMAIEASLAALPEIEVARVSSCLPDLTERIIAGHPELVIIEAQADCGNLRRDLLNRGVSVVELDPNSRQMTLFTSHQCPISEPRNLLDILSIIEQIQGCQDPS